MKKQSLFIAICFASISAFAQTQDTARVNPHLNEFGIDATSFLRQFLNFNNNATAYAPVYYLTYRRHFNAGDLRFEIGGNFSNSQIPNYPGNDTSTTKYYNRSYSLSVSIGWEYRENLGKRWQILYGADFRPSLTYNRDDFQYSNGGYITGTQSQSTIYAIAPFLGVRFKLSKRLSILTETSYSLNWEETNNGNFYTPMPGTNLPPIPSTIQKTTSIFSSFSQPLSVFLDFTI